MEHVCYNHSVISISPPLIEIETVQLITLDILCQMGSVELFFRKVTFDILVSRMFSIVNYI